MSAWEITNQFGESALHAVPDLKTVFDDLASGKTTYAAADLIIGSYVSHTAGTNAQVVGLMQKPGGYCVGVAAGNNDLKPAITEAVAGMRNSGVIDVIKNKWIGSTVDLSTVALTESASKASALASSEAAEAEASSSSAAKTELGSVGGNAVDLKDDGSTPGATENSAGVTDTNYSYDNYNANTYDYNTTTDDTTYVDDGAATYDAGTTDETGPGYDTGTEEGGPGSDTGADEVSPGYDEGGGGDVIDDGGGDVVDDGSGEEEAA